MIALHAHPLGVTVGEIFFRRPAHARLGRAHASAGSPFASGLVTPSKRLAPSYSCLPRLYRLFSYPHYPMRSPPLSRASAVFILFFIRGASFIKEFLQLLSVFVTLQIDILLLFQYNGGGIA